MSSCGPSTALSPRVPFVRCADRSTSKCGPPTESVRVRTFTRRELIVTGSAGIALLALANCAQPKSPPDGRFGDPQYGYGFLNAADRTIVAAVAAAMLRGALSANLADARAALIDVNRGVDAAVLGLPPNVRDEIRELFGLLAFPPARALAAGVWRSWETADPAVVAAFLERWRFSGIALFRSGYQALHQLIMASWYGQAQSWPRIGYPGPPGLP